MLKLIVFDFHGTLTLKSGKGDKKFSLMFEKDIAEKNKINKDEVYIGINDLKNTLKKYKGKEQSWYDVMKKININPEIMMPTLDEVISFVRFMQNLNPNIIFGVASMIEEENFIYDLLKYCFDAKGEQSPFFHKTIVSSSGLKEINIKSTSAHDKWPHIEVIMKRNNLDLDKSEMVIIDDSIGVIEIMTTHGICSVYVDSDYFRIEDWNRGCFKE